MSIHETVEAMQRQASENMAMSLMRMATADDATKRRLRELMEATEKHDAAKRAAETAKSLAEVAEESASRRLAEAEKRAGEIAAEAEAWRKRHAQQTNDLHAGLGELEKQRAALQFEQNELSVHRKRHAAALASLRAFLEDAQ